MTLRVRRWAKYGISIVLTIVLLFVAFRNVEFSRIVRIMKEAEYLWLVLMVILLVMSHVFRSVRWRYFLAPIKPGISIRNLFSGVMVGYLVNNVLPRVGEIVRPYTIGKLESISKSSALGTIVLERMMDGVSFLILLLLIPLVYDGPLRDVFPWLERSGIVLSIVVATLLVIVVVLMMRRDWTTRLTRFAGKMLPRRLHSRFDGIVHSFLDGFLFLKSPASFFPILILTACIWVLYVAMMYVAFFAFHLEGLLGWRAALVVLTISSIGIAIPTPGSAGGYHVFTAQCLNQLFLVPEDVALGYATLTHAVGYVGVTFIGLYFLLKDHVRISEAVTDRKDGGK